MAWVIVKDGAVVREFSRPTAFTYEGYQYPSNWISPLLSRERAGCEWAGCLVTIVTTN